MSDLSDFLFTLVYFILSLGFAIACAVVARREGRSAVGWFILGLFFSILALILLVVLCLWSHPSPETQGLPAGRVKTCPGCAKVIPETSRFCRYCRHEFPI